MQLISGTFMLWWAWLAFNCGSTFGVDNGLWKLAAKAGYVVGLVLLTYFLTI